MIQFTIRDSCYTYIWSLLDETIVCFENQIDHVNVSAMDLNSLDKITFNVKECSFFKKCK